MSAKPLNLLSGMPQLGGALAGWQKPLSLKKRVQRVENGLVVYCDSVLGFRGAVQPLSPESIALKPEGQRSWKWLQIHCQNGTLALATDDQIVFNGQEFKIMAVLDYILNGYVEYHAVAEYQP